MMCITRMTGVASGAALLADPAPTYQPSPLLPRGIVPSATVAGPTVTMGAAGAASKDADPELMEISLSRQTLEVCIRGADNAPVAVACCY